MAKIVQTVINLTRPGFPPRDGDFLRIIYTDGTVDEYVYWTLAPPPEPRYLLSDEEWKSRLTLQEKQWLAKQAQLPTTPGPQIKAFIDAMNMLGAIDVQDADVVAGFEWLVNNTALTSERRDELLAPV